MKKINREYFVKSGRRGGKKTAERGLKYYSDIGKVGNARRWEAYRKLKELNENLISNNK